jgi:hypothetical protein
LIGSDPRVASNASAAAMWARTWTLSSDEPRARIRSPTTTGSNGGEVHSSTGSDGWTS